jgi:hypothetical protein
MTSGGLTRSASPAGVVWLSANADGSTTVTFSPERPADTPEGNWIQTTQGKGWFVLLHL